MPSYDPQRSRHRPSPADDDEPAPVDALLEAHPTEPMLPEGLELELTDAGGAVIHTASADVEVTASGDDVVVSTSDASVEVRAVDEEVVINAGGEEIYVDTTPRLTDEDDVILVDVVGTSRGRSRLVAAVVAALLTVLIILLWNRRRRPPVE
jgi:hypothetical protein